MTGSEASAAAFDSITEQELRARGGRKWSVPAPGCLPAWVAEMDFGTAPCITSALRDWVARAEFGYVHDARTREYAQAVSRWYAAAFGFTFDAERVHAVADVMEALRFTIRAFSRPGSAIVLPTPAYPPMFAIAAECERPVIPVPYQRADHGWSLDLDSIEAALNADGGLLVICNPHNPLGKVHTAEELTAVAEIVQRTGARVFADEIHAPLVLDDVRHVPYASVSNAAASHSVTGFSASKAFNLPGLKAAAVMYVSDEDDQRWQTLGPRVSHGVAMPGLIASIAALNDGHDWLESVVDYLRRNRDYTARVLTEQLPAASWLAPQATYLLWLGLAGYGWTDPHATLAAAGVLTRDGREFGPGGHGCVRLNFATPRPILDRVLDRLTRAVADGGGDLRERGVDD